LPMMRIFDPSSDAQGFLRAIPARRSGRSTGWRRHVGLLSSPSV